MKKNQDNYYANNRQQLLDKARLRYRSNPEPALARARKRYLLKKEEIIDYGKKWRERNPHYKLDQRLRKHQLTREQYYRLLENQNSKCAICKEDFSVEPCIDHHHDTGRVRGLLCNPCNFLIGLAQERTDVLQSAKEYLSA